MKVLRKGDKGDEVIFLQRLLRKLGLVASTDGDFGNKTDAAVRQFQKKNGLSDDGAVGTKSWDALFAKQGLIIGTDIYHGDVTETAFFDDVEKNHWFCFAKATEGGTVQDKRLAEHIAKFKERTILRGAYHFFRFSNPDTDAQVNNFLDATKNAGIVWSDKGILPPVLDVEPIPKEFNEPFRSKITAERADIAARTKKWLTAVEAKTGRTPIIYTTRLIWDDFLKSPKGFEKYPLWVADYGKTQTTPRMPSTWKHHAMWQYTENGTIGGNDGFDVNKLNIPLGDLLKMAGY
jgi:lysozyme